MSLPSFYIAAYQPEQQELILDEDNSRHIIQVLRMKPGQSLQLTDGKGALLTAEIIDDHKKKCRVAIRSAVTLPPFEKKVTIAISPLKKCITIRMVPGKSNRNRRQRHHSPVV